VPDEQIAASLREAGWPVRAVEQGGFELVFVVEPGAFGSSTNVGATALRSRSAMPLDDAEQIRVIVANDSLTAFDALQGASTSARQLPGAGTGGPTGIDKWQLEAVPKTRPRRSGQESWLRRLFLAPLNAPALRRLRTSDAVAVAGYDLGGSSRRRAVVLIAGSERTDESTFSADQARTYLGQTFVPLFVWRATSGSASDWPAGSALRALGPDMTELRRDLDHQCIVWLEGHVDPRKFHPKLPAGIAIAGRSEPDHAPPSRETLLPPRRAADSSAVFAVAVDPGSPRTVYAGTRSGLQVSRDGGDHWTPLRTGAEPGEVYSVAFHPGGREIFFGSSGAIGRSIAGGESWALAPTLAVFSILPSSKDMALAATRGGVFRTSDDGSRWIPSDAGMEKTFALSLAADPRDTGVFYAATAGSGVFKSSDRGRSWKLAGRELDRTVVRCVATGAANGDSVYAGTDGGVFVSADRGKTWQRRSTGLPRAIVYALAPDPADPSRVFAGTAAGLFESRDGAKSWNRMIGPDADAQVTSLALDSLERRLYAGTLGRGVLVLPAR
jgi:photosystem II stability/assembly factor-like uncharacterized protein